jgi:tellurite resistance-related uncharacterized protein
MKTLPANAVLYKTTPEFNQDTVPMGLQRNHTTAANVWAWRRADVGGLAARH